MLQELWESGYGKLALAAVFPIIASVVLYPLYEAAKKKNINYKVCQIIIGIIFGGLAILGTEWGIPLNGAMVNCRDAAPLCAGLIFGGPAGIIAGLLGGIERYLAVYWGVGSFTRIACSVSTAIAGIYAALIRKYMFEGKLPTWLRALTLGTVMEVFHLMMVFFTNIHETEKAIAVVKACSIPMITANGIAVSLAIIFVTLEARRATGKDAQKKKITQSIQQGMLFVVLAVFVLTSVFLFVLQNNMAIARTNNLIDIGISDIKDDIESVANDDLVRTAQNIALEVTSKDLDYLMNKYKVSEIDVVNEKGIITDSTNPDFIGFDMTSGEQSNEFMCLIEDKNVYCQAYGPMTYDQSIYKKYVGVSIRGGFIQVALDEEPFNQAIKERLLFSAQNRHVGMTGNLYVFDEKLDLVSYPADFHMSDLSSFKQQVIDYVNSHEMIENSLLKIKIFDTDYYAKFQKAEGKYIVGMLPVSEAVSDRDSIIYINSFLEILVFALLFGMINIVVQKVIIRRMNKVNEGLDQISQGNLDTVIDVRSNLEFEELSDDINQTVDALKGYIDEAAKKYEEDLKTAKTIQASALPSVFPAFPKRKDLDIYARMDTAKEVGGDFYDFYFTDANTLNFLMADVSGKGIPGAMFMMRAKTELKTLTETGIVVNEVFERGNTTLCDGNDAMMFVTGWQGAIDLKTGLVQFANAGHNPPVLIHKDGTCEYVKKKVNLVLAGMEGVQYVLQELKMEKGDKIFIYTDGVTEATNAEFELYEEERLINCIKKNYDKSCKEICDLVKEDVDAFVKDAPQFDDITMLCLEYVGQNEENG